MPFITRFSDGENHPLTVQLTVRQVPSGPSEIDLDDTRALIDGWSGVRGHLTVTTLAHDRSHGSEEGLTELHAGFAVSATNAAGDMSSMTGALLDLQETYFHGQTMCAVIGE